jgi:hypothetical protein
LPEMEVLEVLVVAAAAALLVIGILLVAPQ